jgi:hypothetical protein
MAILREKEAGAKTADVCRLQRLCREHGHTMRRHTDFH